MKQKTKVNGSTNDDWETPDYILDSLIEEFGLMFDPCPLNALDSDFDGLSIDWKPITFVNPPYNRFDKPRFIKKAIQEAQKNCLVILLIPSNTDTNDFKLLWNHAKEIRFINNRVKFKGYNTKGEYVTNKNGQTGSMIVILDKVIPKFPKVSLVDHEQWYDGNTL